jgi:phage terminase large subunit-like protein
MAKKTGGGKSDGPDLSKMSTGDLRKFIADAQVHADRVKKLTAFASFTPFPFQKPWYDAVTTKTCDVVALFCANQVGKSTFGGEVVVAESCGAHPPAISGNPLPARWERDICKGKRILACGESFEVSLRDTIVPKIREFVTDDMLLGPPKRNNLGIPVVWRFKSGAELVLMSYQQSKDSFEGAVWDMVWFDEPPPFEMFSAIRRGTMARKGQILITATPLKEPWMLDELVLPSRDPTHPSFGTVAEFTADIWDNAVSNGGVLPDKQIATFLAGLPEKERMAREFGQFLDVQGLEFSYVTEENHVVPDFVVPAFWPIVEVNDPSYKRGHHVSWFTCSPDDEWFCVQAAVIQNGSFSEMCNELKKRRNALGRLPDLAIMDSRGGQHEINKDHQSNWFDEFRKRDVHYVPSQDVKGAAGASITRLHEWMKPAWDTKKEKFVAKLRMTSTVAQVERGPLWAFRRFQFNPAWSVKRQQTQPAKDFVDTWKYLSAHKGLTFRRLSRNAEEGHQAPRISQSYAPPRGPQTLYPRMPRRPQYGRTSRSRRV